MAEENEKIYCGTGKIVPTQYGELTKVSFHKDHINTMVKYMKDNDTEWINLVVKEKRDKVEGKPTHYLEVDTWKPKDDTNNNTTPPPTPKSAPVDDYDDLPF